MLEIKETREALRRFAKHVVSQSRANLTRMNKNASKKLYDSIGWELEGEDKGMNLKVLMEDYGMFQDQGVKGIISGSSLSNFSYKSKGGVNGLKGMPPPSAFDKWNIRRGRAARDEKGRFLTRLQLNFKTAVGVFKYGIKPSLFLTKPFEKAFENLPQELIEAYQLDIREIFKNTKK